MQDPGHLQGPPLAPDPPRRQRQERTVYNQSQQEVLELYFQREQYPNYDERLNLAKTLGFREQQLQVWFKNRRAKLARVRRLQQQPQRVPGRRGRGARAAPLVPAAAASAPQPGPSGILPAAEPTICSLDQAWGGPGCRAQKGIPAALSPGLGPIPAAIPGPAQVPGPIPGPAQIPGPISGPISSPNPGLIPGQISGPGPIIDPIPGPAQIPGPGRLRGPAPAPLWPQSPDASDFLPDTQLFPHFTELLPPLDPLEGSSVSTMTSQYQEGDDCMGKKDSGSQHQEEGGSVNENHSGPRSLLDL
ncbi:tetra-peptide repeat homeobox protein 1 isoform X3 [Hylobates moloch]|uniref:tetra-peptide repeat homeobox protein 1 isoform X3 n=1 Tax=Hylobates moloch TaxID=81572 RepID=UPI001364663B|nr:tetra-peptide repeat homeobox protein 1 isoform X3 [Hylobates moloch]